MGKDQKRADGIRQTAQAFVAAMRCQPEMSQLKHLVPADSPLIDDVAAAIRRGVSTQSIRQTIADTDLSVARNPARLLGYRIGQLTRPVSASQGIRPCPLHRGNADALNCRCCRSEVMVGQDPYAGREHLRPAGWAMTYQPKLT